ncbi:nitroreductase/quinone reductase family protein [Nocardia farcinica]|uniref:nitroreductase/quinone reductase family protein n=1 Tax=Nocardia farcinica TaxID=37329 RepID=UPI0037A6350A
MDANKVAGTALRGFNAGLSALLDVPVLGPLLSKGLARITYVGRRSGRTISTPVGYRRVGDDIVIGVAMPQKKSWWRNFLGDGAPITVHINGIDRRGHAVATKDERGGVSVRVRFQPQG